MPEGLHARDVTLQVLSTPSRFAGTAVLAAMEAQLGLGRIAWIADLYLELPESGLRATSSIWLLFTWAWIADDMGGKAALMAFTRSLMLASFAVAVWGTVTLMGLPLGKVTLKSAASVSWPFAHHACRQIVQSREGVAQRPRPPWRRC